MTEQDENDQYRDDTQGQTCQTPAESDIEDSGSNSEGFGDLPGAEPHGANETPNRPQHSQARSPFTSTFSVLVLIAMFTIGAVGTGAYFAINTISQQADNIVVRVLIQDEVIELKEGQLGEFNATVERAVLEKHEAAYTDIESEVHTRIDDLFEKSEANITEFVDWYYSVIGSGIRFIAWTQDGGAEYVSDEFADQVFGGDDFENEMLHVHVGAQQYLQDLEGGIARQVNQELLAQFDARSTELVDHAVDDLIEVNVSEAVRQAVRFSLEDDQARWWNTAIASGGSTAVAAAATASSGGLIASRVIMHSPRISHALAISGQRVAALIGQRTGAAVLRGAVASAATFWSGPMVSVVAVTAMVGTEYAQLKTARRTEGREMEESLRKGLAEVRDEVKREITTEYRQQIDRRLALVEETLHNQATRVDDSGEFYVLGTRTH